MPGNLIFAWDYYSSVSVGRINLYILLIFLAELDKDFTDRQVILAAEVDGKPLPEGDGQFRIIVQDEKKPARCIKMVTAITIKFVK